MEDFRFSPEVVEALEGRFELLSCLKHTEYRHVYLARDMQSGERVVLKLTYGEAREQLRREHALLTLLSDDGFPRAKELMRLGAFDCLVREYVPGIALDQYADTRQLAPREAVELALKACRIARLLQSQHMPLVHRDLSPANFVLRPDGSLCLIDLDSIHSNDSQKPGDTVLLGTPGTAAPEQYGARRSDQRTDVYGLGMLSVYLLTGGMELQAIEKQHLPVALRRAIRRATQFDPSRRYASVAQLERTLRRALPKKPPGRARLAAAALALFALGIATGTLASYWQQRPTGVVRFASPPIARAVELQLSIPADEITFEHLRLVETLVVAGETVCERFDEAISYGKDNVLVHNEMIHTKTSTISLQDVQHMPNLKQLGVYCGYIEDISPLRGLKLTHLALSNNPVSDLGALSGMATLEYLDICATQVSDLSPLGGLTNLTHLRLQDAPATDLSPVCALPIEQLLISGNNYEDDPGALCRFTALRNLSVERFPENSLPFINQLTELTHLSPIYYPAKTLEPLSGLNKLRSLYLINENLESLDGIEGMTSLESVSLMSVNGADAAPLTKLPNLQTLNLYNSSLVNLSEIPKDVQIQTF